MSVVCRRHGIKVTVESLEGVDLLNSAETTNCDVLFRVLELIPAAENQPYPCGLAEDGKNVLFRFEHIL